MQLESVLSGLPMRIHLSSLKAWLASRHSYPTAVFGNHDGSVDYPHPQHPHYAPKLALMPHAWRETKVQDHGCPRQVLRETRYRLAPAYGLVNRDGAPLKHVIKECGRVANWRPEGGAPKKES
ncbi:hypothetical protein [Paludibacterium sp.]|uniref:hypothetical protein n=1 Tax=Paludibacterium sp. TaxID=1917523 RepID=UPI0025D60A8F|nr:hypothetical protein [Paludibacterium sp.]MBV8647029.1 hypothetical protein [Paludibacterium sp.]